MVPDEVYTLASRTQQSIHEMVEKLQVGSREDVQVMESSRDTTLLTMEKVGEVANSLNKITDAVGVISDMNTQIASAAEEQSAVAQEIDKNIVQISSLAAHGAEQTTHVSYASGKLSKISNGMVHTCTAI